MEDLQETTFWKRGFIGEIPEIMSSELSDKANKRVIAALLALAAAAGCSNLSTAPIRPTDTATGDSETDPFQEFSTTYPGVFLWNVSPDIIDKVANTKGLSENNISGYTIQVDRSVIGLHPYEIKFATGKGPDLDNKGEPIVHDYMFVTETSMPDELFRELIVDADGHEWVRQYTVVDGEQITVQLYPADTNERLARGETVVMLFFPPNDDVKAQMPGLKDGDPIRVIISPKPEDNAVATAPTPFSAQPVSYSIRPASPDVAPTKKPPTPTVMPTPEPSPTAERTYNCPVNPTEAGISQVSLKEDIQSGKLAEWALKHPKGKVIAKDPSKLDYHTGTMGGGSIRFLAATSTDTPGYGDKYSQVIGVCKISPKEFGLQDKNGDLYIIVSVMEDKNGKRVPEFTLATLEMVLRYYRSGWMTDPSNGFEPWNNYPQVGEGDFIVDGAAPNGEDDLRQIIKNGFLLNAQGVTLKEVQEIFEEIAKTDTFGDASTKLFSRTVFFAGTYKDLKP